MLEEKRCQPGRCLLPIGFWRTTGSKLEETAQESDEVQTDVVKSQTGLQKGYVKYGARVPHGGLKFNTLSKVRKYLRRTGVFKVNRMVFKSEQTAFLDVA